MKMPEPMMPPITTIVASNGPERAAEGHAPHYTSGAATSRRSLEAASGGLR